MERRLVIAAMLGAAAAAPLRAAARVVTPRLTMGPYYPPVIPADNDWDLVRSGRRTAIGQVLMIEGRVLQASGGPAAGAIVEIWQCDANGRYLHPDETFGKRPRDPGFQGYGAIVTDAQGRYRFRTVRPPGYAMPGAWGGGMRTPHVHFAVRSGGMRRLATQMFFPDEPLNDQDGILLAAGAERRRALIGAIAGKRSDGAVGLRWDIVLPG